MQTKLSITCNPLSQLLKDGATRMIYTPDSSRHFLPPPTGNPNSLNDLFLALSFSTITYNLQVFSDFFFSYFTHWVSFF